MHQTPENATQSAGNFRQNIDQSNETFEEKGAQAEVQEENANSENCLSENESILMQKMQA